MKNVLFILSLYLLSNPCFGQEVVMADSLELPEFRIDKNFKYKFARELSRLRRVYPMALHAKKLIDEYEADLADISKKRKKKKYGKEAHSELKDDFFYSIKDLYTSEGILLMQLIHRETGMTVRQIIEKYRGKTYAKMYEGMGKLFDQDLDATYDPNGVNWLTEIILKDIYNGQIPFDFELAPVTKQVYKDTKKDEKALSKKRKKDKRKKKKEARKEAIKKEKE